MQQAAAAPAGPSPVLVAPAQRGFPWVPFTIVLVLVATGLGFAMMDGEPSGSKGKTKKDDPSTLSTETGDETLPSVDEETCEPVVNTTATTSDTAAETDTTPSSETVTGASSAIPTTPPAPAVSDGSAGSLLPDGSSTTSTGAITSTTSATAPTTAQVYTDQDGNLCTPTTGTDTTSTSITTPSTSMPTHTNTTSTSPTAPTGSTGSSGTDTQSATTWPAGRSGYTVVIASFPKSGYDHSDAEVRATQAQRNGVTAGVLDSDQFSSLTGGLWVVFSGVFSTESAANSHKSSVTKKGYQPYVRQVTPT